MEHDFFEYEIQYQDVDEQHRLRLYTLENYLFNAACVAADRRGFGVSYLQAQNLTWVLTTLTAQIDRLPQPGEKLKIETWVEQNVHLFSMRNFRLFIDDQLVGKVHSVWVVLHLQNRTAQHIFSQPIFQTMEAGERLDLPAMPHPQPLEQPTEKETHKIVYSDIDYNGHCNSCKYLEFMLNTYPLEADAFPLLLEIKYAKEVYKGETVEILCQHDPKEAKYLLHNEKGELSCAAQIIKIAEKEGQNLQD